MNLPKIKILSIEGVSYNAKFPTVGQYIEIQNLKVALSNGNYEQMALSQFKGLTFSARLIDVISTFSVLIPDLLSDLSVKSYTNLDPIIAKKLLKVFENDFQPWYQEWLKILFEEDEEKKEETKSEDEINS
jgi:hypothetical protein